ncbi:SCO family protein [Christiangramia fulva]|uniref:SCO family protein n=1 Tax=Christiangramia fulva TaxID=2126553 RepID=A0A2R3Z2Y7_9FLAO|nr:SCO family protein [Christiangramia fulva]AVR44640.1 SCO family protein [Christiangramia fulva]
MKKMILAGVLSLLLFASCNNNSSKKTSKVIASNEKEAVVKNDIPDMSLFNLSSTWTTQNGKDIKLADLQGDVLVMVMIYTSCTTACPRLVADMKNIEERLPEAAKKHVKMVFVSIDPETDTPERLKTFAQDRNMDQDPWLFLRSSEENTREFAAVVAVNYKEINPMTFSHSNIISVFSPKGELLFQQEGLGVNSDETVQSIETAVSEM